MKNFSFMLLLSALTACSPLLSTTPLYSDSDLEITPSRSAHYSFKGLTDENLKLLFDSTACPHFNQRIWNTLHTILFQQSPPPAASFFQKKIKSYAQDYMSSKQAHPRAIRKFSSLFSDIYQLALEFFKNKSKEKVLEEYVEIEELRANPDLLKSYEKRTDIRDFLLSMRDDIKELKTLSKNLDWQCQTPSAPSEHHITFHVGMNMFEMAEHLHKTKFIPKNVFLETCADTDFISSLLDESLESAEGYLYPGTYQLKKRNSKALVRLMVNRFLDVYNEIESANGPISLSRHKTVTMASMIEEEALMNFEKPLMSSVFHNRLDIDMKLQSDPTASYGLRKLTGSTAPHKTMSKIIRTSSPYNTYLISGLPPGPITNPGRHALQAVFNPEETPYYYFVSNNGQTHIFSRTYQEHKRAIRSRRL